MKFCKNGEWIEIVVDDYIPCYPKGGPIFSHNNIQNELWMSILEKAYAKMQGSYEALEKGIPVEALSELSGYPTMSLTLRDENIFEMI